MSINKWILCITSIIIITFAAIGFFEISATSVINSKLLPDLPFSVFSILLLSCLIMPIIEEFGFRYWILAEGWKKYLSIFLAFLFVASTSNLVIIAGFVLILTYILLAKASIPIKVISSSIFFSLLHLNIGFNLSFFSFFTIFFLLGVLFSLLYLKKGIWLAIITHISYNTILLLFLGNDYKGFKDKTEVFTLNQTTCTLQHHNIFYTNLGSSITTSPDTIVVKNKNKSKIVWSLLNKHEDFIYDVEPSLDKISFIIKGTSAIDRQGILIKVFNLKFDTLEAKNIEVYELLYRPNTAQIAASKQRKAKKDYTNAGPINDLATSLTSQYDKEIKSKDTNYVYLNIPYMNSFEQNKQILESQYGLKFIKSTKKARKINVSFGG